MKIGTCKVQQAPTFTCQFTYPANKEKSQIDIRFLYLIFSFAAIGKTEQVGNGTSIRAKPAHITPIEK